MAGEFITLHGIDAVGKTSITHHLAEYLRDGGTDIYDWQSFAKEAGVAEIPSRRDDFTASIAKKVLEGEAVARFLDLGKGVIKDRWVIDILASHAFKGTLVGSPERHFAHLLKPDFSVILVCDENERMQRVHQRPTPTPEDLVPRVPGTRAYFFQEYLLANIHTCSQRNIIFDTTGLAPQRATELIIERMRRGRDGV